MLKIERDKKRLVSFSQFQPVPLPKSEDLRELICNSAAEFFGEFGEEVFLIEGDIWPAEAAQVRADVVALDRHGRSVAIILPRAGEDSQLARAIASVGILARCKPEDFLRGLGADREDKTEQLVKFLGVDLQGINHLQRAILVAERHDVTVLTAAKWLREQSGLDITCIDLSLTMDSANTEFLSFADPSAAKLPIFQLIEPARSASRPVVKSGQRNPLPWGVERRKQLRTLKYDTQHLRLGYGQTNLAVTQLIDLTDRGLGAETKDPLSVGAYVTVSGDLHGAESAVKLEGRARVAHCRRENGSFRVGLSFEEIRCQDLY